MKQSFKLTSLGLLVALLCATVASAQDRVYPHKGGTIAGGVQTITKDSVTVKVGADTQTLPSNTIRRIIFEGDPVQLGRGRDFVLDGQYESALAELLRVDPKSLTREESKAEYMFYRSQAAAKLALSGNGSQADAAKAMLAFVGTYRESWHFYDAAQSLGDLAMAMGNAEAAARYYGALSAAPFPEYQLQARYLEGLALLTSGKQDDAMQRFDAVISANASTPEALRVQQLSKAGRAVALARSAKTDEAMKELDVLIDQCDTSDAELCGRLYNARGLCLIAKEDFMGAALAYLHTDLLFSAAANPHLESLKQLVELWNKLGQPDRAASTRSRLQQLYPGAAS